MEYANVRGTLLQYRNHPAMLKRFPNGDFNVRGVWHVSLL
jgi:hypothetical protein